MSSEVCNAERCISLNWFRETTEELSKEEAQIAEEAKQGALKILQDALKKKDKVLMKLPEQVVLEGEEKEKFWMERHAVLTEDAVKKLLAELKTVRFKKNIYMCREVTTAYVISKYEAKTIFLCKEFWKCQKYLGRNSQPGIIIHEVSHLLGTEDITYKEDTLYFGCKGSRVKVNPMCSIVNSPLKQRIFDALQKAFWNATNIQRELEITINHSKPYVWGKYHCCGETKRYSVCEKSVPDYFHDCNIGKKWQTEKCIIKNIIQKSKVFPPRLRWLYETVHEMGESLRNFSVTDKENCWDDLWNSFWNAEKMEYEPELTLNYEGNYTGDEDIGCWGIARYSVCDRSMPDVFHTCGVGGRRISLGSQIEIQVKELCDRSRSIKSKLKQCHRIVDEIEESLRKAQVSRKVGFSIAGGAAAAGLFLAPATLGVSALVAGAGLAGSGVSLISTVISNKKATTKEKELNDIFAECQSFLDNVKTVIVLPSLTVAFWRDFIVPCCSCTYLEYIAILINLIMEQVEIKRDCEQKKHMYMGGMIQCAYLLESLYKIFYE